MNETVLPAVLADARPVNSRPLDSRPLGAPLQPAETLSRRRRLVLGLNLVTYAAFNGAVAAVLGAGGWSLVDGLMMLCALLATPWTVLGFWNALIGLWLLHGARDGLGAVAPFARAGEGSAPLTVDTAVLMTLRNEDPARAFARLKVVKDSIERTGEGGRFAYFILSDTSSPEVAEAEERMAAAWRASSSDPERIHYRRRRENTGFKAGNLRDFCAAHGRDFELMLPLDADSLMSGEAVVRLARIMQAHPNLGILQSLVVGAPARSAFARIFQFGMRHGMRAYTFGSAWWAGDCGPFWGHNAMVRIAPFARHCDLPVLPGGPPLGGHILSHDQVEACLMRRAGYEARVLPVEDGSYEDNPPTLLDFSVRDTRWCQGNMQYWRLLALPGLLPMSRFQLAWAILMFLGVPAMTLLLALLPFKLLDGEDAAAFPAGLALALYLAFLLMYLAPKLAGVADILLTRGGAARYGGAPRLVAGALGEAAFSFLLGAVTTFRLTLFMAGLLFGRAVGWNGQSRDAIGLPWGTAARALWAPTLFGAALLSALFALSPAVLLWSLPLTLGYVLAIPFAVATASPRLAELAARWRLCAIPEELETPPEIAALGSP